MLDTVLLHSFGLSCNVPQARLFLNEMIRLDPQTEYVVMAVSSILQLPYEEPVSCAISLSLRSWQACLELSTLSIDLEWGSVSADNRA